MKKNIAFALSLGLSIALTSGAPRPSGIDKNQFSSPSSQYHPETWFHFVDGNVDKEGITKDLEAISAAGISGVQFFHGGGFGGSWPGVTDPIYCLSENWEDILSHTAREAKRLGLKFTMQNCPGWSMSGGPWITKENAMRGLLYTRTDVIGGCNIKMHLDAARTDPDSDYNDICVLAFPRNEDNPHNLVPLSVKSNMDAESVKKLLSGQPAALTHPGGNENLEIEVVLSEDTPVRTFSFNNPEYLNHRYSYDLKTTVRIEAEDKNGNLVKVLDTPIPMGAWWDRMPTNTFALDEVCTHHLFITIASPNPMKITRLDLLSAARTNAWEMKAGWALRAIPYASEYPVQDPASYIKPEDIIDISSYMDKEGNLDWNAPEGIWTILRFGHGNIKSKNSPAPPEATGWECDKFSTEGVEAHFNGYIGKYADTSVKGLLDGMLLDSWEAGNQTWSRNMEKDFSDFTGYSLRTWLPALYGYVIGDQQTTSRFLFDWRKLINHLLVDNFYGHMAHLAKEKGLTLQYETAGGDVCPIDMMEYYKYADIPMTEFWNDSQTDNYVGSINFKPVRPTASAAHIYGKTRVAAESFTSFWLTWNEDFRLFKENANRHLAQGVTHEVFHTYTHNPMADTMVPGTSFGSGIGSPFLRGQTWWKYMPEFTDYLARCCYMLERGVPSSDVLWYIGDDMNHKPDQKTEYMKGYNYDYCNPDVLRNRLSVKDGRIVTPEGLSYKILWYPRAEVIDPETVYRLLELVREGAVLATVRPRGLSTLMSYDKERYESAMAELYGNGEKVRNVGKGKVYLDAGIVDVLHSEGIEEDLRCGALDWMHRKSRKSDWYFVAAPEGGVYNGEIDFRCTGKVEIWDPVTGKTSVPECKVIDGRTHVQINLPRRASCFVVFTRGKTGKPDTQVEQSSIDLSSDWTLSFPTGWGAPEHLALKTLVPWKDLDISEEGKAFSGTATYRKTIHLDEYSRRKTYTLALGDFDSMAEIKVNGKKVRLIWTEPYTVDISRFLRKGDNEIAIDLTSTWFNRLVFDASLDNPDERKTWTISGPSKDEPLKDSGLYGPVTLSISK